MPCRRQLLLLRRIVSLGLVLVGTSGVFLGVTASAASNATATPRASGVREARLLEQERTGVDSPSGLAFSAATGSFYVTAARPASAPETEVVRLTPYAGSSGSDRAGQARIAAAIGAPVNVAFDERGRRLLLLDEANRLLEVRAGASGDLDPDSLVRREALRLDLTDPQGMSVDPTSGVLFVLDAAGPRIVRVEPAPDGSFESATTSDLDLRGAGASSPRGLAFDPSSGHLQLASAHGLLELTSAGALVATRDLSSLALGRLAGMSFAPSGDETDDQAQLSLYAASSGAGSGSGAIVELSLSGAQATPPIDFTSSLVTTVDVGGLSPPSTDPSGITYQSASDRLVISDGEVEETVNGITHFQGANVWELDRAGLTLNRTANISNVPPTTVPMTNEPTGVAYNPSTGHFFVSDDSGKRVYDLNPGADGLVGTAGDSWSSFDTSAAGNTDPEGVTYDTFGGHLFVADGLNREIYEYTTTGTPVGHFDTAQWGIEDPETVEFNPVNGTLLILSDRSNTSPPAPLIIETTTSGTLLQTIDASASGALKPAGLAYAPASNGSGAKRFYIVDRGVDNNSDPSAVDGKLYELTAPTPGQPGNTPPTVGAGPDGAATLPASIGLDGTVSDDGNPNPPGALTTAWTQVGGPGLLTFADASAVDTTASASIAGVYTARLTASDGQFQAFDEVTLTFTGSGSAQSLDVRVSVGADDAEESTSNVVLIGNGDLDLMVGDEGNLVVGTRFRNVTLPRGATITNAYLQFTADEVHSGTTTLTLKAQASDNPPVFTTTSADLSSRPQTSAAVGWSVPSWLAVGDAGLAQRTPNLAPLIQEIVGRSGWASGNALVLLVTGSGTRVAESYNGSNLAAPLLHLEWTTGGGNVSPVIVSDGGGPSASVSPAENQTFAADVEASDPDPDTLTYTLAGGADAARFAIDNSTGVVSFLAPPNFEAPTDAGANNVYDVVVSVSDGHGGSDSQAIAASVQNVNESSPIITSNGGGDTAALSRPENATAVTTVTATDADFNPLAYALSGGTDSDDFTIDASTGVLTFTLPPDFETPTDANLDNVYEVTVEASDGSLSDTQALAVMVTDVVEGGNAPPTITSGGGGDTAPVSTAENATAATDVDASDPDSDPLSYSLAGGPDASRFAIDASSGALAFVTAPNYELPTDVGANNVYDVSVSVSDGHGGSDSQALAVTVLNVNEFAPVISSNGGGPTASLSRPENSTAVTDVDASDADLTSPTYAITAGADQSDFQIDPSTGVLTFAVAPDFESPGDADLNNVYLVTVTATDGTNLDAQSLTVTVTDVVESSASPLYFTLQANGTVGGVSVANEDVVSFDGTTFSVYFDGSDVGLGKLRVDAFARLDATTLLFSFDTETAVPGLGTVDDSDVVRFTATSLGVNTAGTFSWYFDGSDVGLTTSGQDVDAFELLGDGTILLSTADATSLMVVGAVDDSDLVRFTPTSLGEVTAGSFSLYFDGSDVGLTTNAEDVDAAAVDSAGRIYLSVGGAFSVTGASGQDEDVFVFTPTSTGSETAGTFGAALAFDGSAYGLDANDLFAIDVP